jgi:hypothetical protein
MSTATIPGSAGGRAVLRKYGPKFFSRIGRLGGNAVVEKYGSTYMSLLGTLGADAVNENLSNWKYNRIRGTINRILRENQ